MFNLEELGTIEGNQVTKRDIVFSKLETTPDYDICPANSIDFIARINRQRIMLGDHMIISRGGKVIGEGFPRYAAASEDGYRILLTDNLRELKGDDVDDAPASANTCMGGIYDGNVVELKKGDNITLVSSGVTRGRYEQRRNITSLLRIGAPSLFK